MFKFLLTIATSPMCTVQDVNTCWFESYSKCSKPISFEHKTLVSALLYFVFSSELSFVSKASHHHEPLLSLRPVIFACVYIWLSLLLSWFTYYFLALFITFLPF